MKEFLKYTLATIVGVFVTMLMLGLLLFFSIAGLISSSGKKKAKVSENSVLEINIDYDVQERTNNDLSVMFNPDANSLSGLDVLLSSIHKAETDPNIKGIILKTNMTGTGYATMLELRNALKSFKGKGKFIYSLAPYYDEKNYYLSSVADSVFIEKSGSVLFNGLAANIVFFKGLLDKAGIEAQYVKVGAYKGAIESYTRSELSPENRQQIQEQVHEIFKSVVSGISESRKIDTATIAKAFNDFSIQTPQQAVKFGLIDRIIYKDELYAGVAKKVKAKTTEDLNILKPDEYSGDPEESDNKTKDKIAVVYAVGEIIEGKGNQSVIGSESMCKALKKAREDKDVKAIVLRINSPGGSSMASDAIAREVALCKGIKPVVVSMSDVAASGGYYIAAMADSIIALPNTITGSIGVFGLFPNMHELLTNKLGITFETVKTGTHSDFGRVDQPLSPDDLMFLQNRVNQIYKDFTEVVQKGRNMDSASVEAIAQGRVWTATQALNIRLIDSYGGIDDAIKIAAHMSKTKQYHIVDYPKIDNPFKQFLENQSNAMMETKMKTELGMFYNFYKYFRSGLNAQGYQMRLPFEFSIQ